MAIHKRPVPQTYTSLASPAQDALLPKGSADAIAEDGGWRPIWLRRTVFISFLICFLLLIAGLETILAYSDKENGLASPSKHLHYLWTYGPTGVFTIIMALWHRVDYRIRQMMPWISMSKKDAGPAATSIFQDYLSPTMPEILWHSCRNQDFVVAASILILNLLTLSTIISTGLLSLTEVPITLPAQYRTTSKFVNDMSQQIYESSLSANIYDAIDTLNLPYPFGTTDQVAYQPFELIDNVTGSSSSVQQAPVKVLTFDLDCQEAALEVGDFFYYWENICGAESSNAPDSPTISQNLSLAVPDCKVTNTVTIDYAYGYDQQIGNFAFFDATDTKCQGLTSNRVFFGIGQAQQQGDIASWSADYGCNRTSPRVQIDILRSKQWICVPNIVYRHANVSFNSTTFEASGLPEISQYWDEGNETVPDNVSWTLLASISLTFMSEDFQDGKPIPFHLMGVDNLNEAGGNAPEVRILRKAPNATIDEMLSTDLYANLSKHFFTSALAQITHLWITAEDYTPVQGSITVNESRLVVGQPPVRAMQVILGLASLLLLFITAVMRTKNVVSCDTARISGVAQVMKDNPRVRSLFNGTGPTGLTELREAHGSSLWQSSSAGTGSDKHIRFFVQHLHDQASSIKISDENKIEWWRPLTAMAVSRSLMFVFVICLVVAFQVLLAFSGRNQGLYNMGKSMSEHYAWSLAPAVIMTLVATYVRALNGVYTVFAPYCLLQKGAVAARTLCRNFQSMTDYEILLHAMHDGQFGVLLMTCSVILSSFLTIIVSGVFTNVPVALGFDTSMETTSWFTASNSTDNGTAGNSAVIAGLILMANLSFPRWTYNDLVFPEFQMTESETQHLQNWTDTLVQATLPAIRPSLNCTLYDQNDIPNLGYYASNSYSGLDTVRANFPGPIGCVGNLSDPTLFTGNLDVVTDGKQIYFADTVQHEAKGCPTLISIWGHHVFANDKNETRSNITYAKALACFETIEQVDVVTTLTYPSLAISPLNPPRPLEETAKVFSTADIALPYGSMPWLNLIESLNPQIWSAIIYSYGLNGSDLGKPDMTDFLVEAFKKSHKIVRAQQYNVALRTDVIDSNVPSTITANVTDWGKSRLIQDPVSTSILCALLIAILVCSLIASMLMSTRKVLPKNPSSIAATMSLLADSNIFGRRDLWAAKADRNGSKFVKDPETKFRMGWIESAYTIYAVDAVSEDYEFKGTVSEHEIRGTVRQKGPYISLQQAGIYDLLEHRD